MTPPETNAKTYSGSPMAVALVVFVVMAAISAGVIWNLEQRNRVEQRMRLSALAGGHAHAIQTTMERALSAT